LPLNGAGKIDKALEELGAKRPEKTAP